MDYTTLTLGTLMTFKDETVKRQAMAIFKRLPAVLASQAVPCTDCGATPDKLHTQYCTVGYKERCDAGRAYARASESRATDTDRFCRHGKDRETQCVMCSM